MPSFQIVDAETCHRAWLYSLHKQALGPYVERVYGWDDEEQRRQFADRSSRHKDHLILVNQETVGMVSYRAEDSCIRLLRIEITPQHQRKGIGTDVILYLVDMARQSHKSVELRVFKINPAKRLYERLGFVVTGETDTHYHMKWKHTADQETTRPVPR